MSKNCIVCGTELEDEAIFCDECGVKQGEETEIKIQNERTKLIEELEWTNRISSKIANEEVFKHMQQEELEILEKNAKGQNDKVIMVIAIIALIGTVICFINFGFIGGIIGFFVSCWIGDGIESIIRIILINKNREAVEAAKKVYFDKKDELEMKIKNCEVEMEELKSDICYKKYAYLLRPGILPYSNEVPKVIIEALKEGKANTLEEAIKFTDKV